MSKISIGTAQLDTPGGRLLPHAAACQFCFRTVRESDPVTAAVR